MLFELGGEEEREGVMVDGRLVPWPGFDCAQVSVSVIVCVCVFVCICLFKCMCVCVFCVCVFVCM